VGDVYQRVETAAGRDFEEIEALRLAALVHSGELTGGVLRRSSALATGPREGKASRGPGREASAKSKRRPGSRYFLV
jgi:hypothetical protein